MLKYKNIFIFILFILFIYTIINLNNNKQSHQQYKDETQFIIDSSNNLLIKNSEDNYSYYLNENNLLNIDLSKLSISPEEIQEVMDKYKIKKNY